ncbi:MAG TPA: hypothetical protein VJR29_14380 [bacterium]|nr:hypothetical protein [bacterium]
MIRSLSLLALLLLPFSSALGAEVPVSETLGKYGFDWLKPAKAKCAVLTEKNLAGLKSCQYMKEGDTGSFSGKADFYTCKVGEKSEYMVYKSQARCSEELQTMQANEP